MSRRLLVSLAAAASAAVSAAPGKLGLSVSPDGSYSVSVDGAVWLSSGGAPSAVVAYGNALHSTADGSLKADAAPAPVSGANYTGFAQTFNNGVFGVEWQFYEAANAIIFVQNFPKGLSNMNINGGDSKDLATAFPVFNFTPDASKAFLTWPECMCSGATGLWTAQGSKGAGLTDDGGSPLVLFDAAATTLVLSSYAGFMTANVGTYKATGGSLGAGYNGMLESVPAGHAHHTVIVAGSGVNDTVMAYGDLLLAKSGKHRTRPDADLIISTLGYWTDNGAYYYYLTEPAKTMQQTVLDVLAYLNTLALPVRHLMYDSWWYWKECNGASPNTWLNCRGALELWEPRNDVFPDGFKFKEPLPLALHNRWISGQNNTYIEDLGFASSFIVEEKSDFALPIKADVFEYMMGRAKAWGMVLYEQDWLITVWRGMNVTRSSIDASSTWLKAMADAATALGVTIQYCMPLPRHMLESTNHQAVTNARASGDYHPGAGNFDISQSSLFYWALGVAPSKDDWWTTEVQTGSPYSDKPTEPNWQLQAIVVGLSTGPNGPSDKIGATNATLVMSTVRGDGLNLQPDRPATTLDAALLRLFAGSAVPDVRSTWCAHDGHSLRWHSVLATQLSAPFTFSATDLGPAGTAPAYAVFDWFNPAGGALAVMPVDGSKSFTIPVGQGQPSAPSAAHAIRYYIVAPQLPGGFWMFGENAKVVTTSHQRIYHFQQSADGFNATVLGSAGEPSGVAFWIAGPKDAGVPKPVLCPSAAGKTATLACSAASDGCTCA